MTEPEIDRAIAQGRLSYRLEAEPGSDCERMRAQLAETLHVVTEERDQLRLKVAEQADTIDDLVRQMERIARERPGK